MSQHKDRPAEECPPCRRIFAACEDAHAAGLRPTAAELGQRTGLGERALRVHRAHLVRHAKLEADRLTPVPGATCSATQEWPSDDFVTPLDWVLTVATRDTTCRTMLRVHATHADESWSGRMGLADLAKALDCSLRTAGTHRRHLVEDGHLRTVADPVRPGAKTGGRRPDKYVLMSGIIPRPVNLARTWDQTRALEVMVQVPWWPSRPDLNRRAVQIVGNRLASGWPEGELVARLAITPESAVTNPVGLLQSLLPAKGEPYVLPAREAATGRAWKAPLCACCGVQFARDVPARPGDVCGTCRADGAEGPAPAPPEYAQAAYGAYGTPF